MRQQVRNFAGLMESVLKENDHKGGWNFLPKSFLTSKLNEEVSELKYELKRGNDTNVAKEAADVANIALMIADNWGKHGISSVEQDQQIAELTDALSELIDENPCHFDYRGHCQTHEWPENSECPQAKAKKLLRKYRN